MRIAFAAIALATAFPAGAVSSTPFAGDHIAVTLISESDALVPGASAWLGLRLQHEPHWHTYWVNPGDSGLPTKLAWHLPDGFRAGDIAWPAPKRFALGELYNFGYDGDVLLPVKVEVSPSAQPGSTVAVSVDAKWLVCEEQCIPGKATLTLDLPVRTQATPDAATATLFAGARAAQPQAGAWKAVAQLAGERIEVRVRGADLGTGDGLDAYAENGKIVANAPPQIETRDGSVVLIFLKSDYFTALPKSLDLVLRPRDARALRVHAFFPRGS